MGDILRPTQCLASVAELNLQRLASEVPSLNGITWDLDKTLVGQHESVVPEAHLEVMQMISKYGYKQGIISNAGSHERTDRVNTIAKNIGHAIGSKIYVVTSLMVGGKRKPLRPPYDEMSRLMDVPNKHLCHIGDQLLKDIFGANRSGYAGSVLVAPYGEGDDLGVKYLQRPLEAAIRPFLGLPLLSKNLGK